MEMEYTQHLSHGCSPLHLPGEDLLSAAQTQIPRESPIPSPSPRISTSTVTVDDLRFWHHYLVDARPGLPIGDEGTWSSQIPIFAHDCPHLLHALLSLGASYCSLASPQGYQYAPLVIAHRGKALKALGAILAKGDNCTITEVDSALATCIALTFQARHMSDGVIDFAVMVRGCSDANDDPTVGATGPEGPAYHNRVYSSSG
ncbi:hypothetical protein CNMCM5878_004425 [Aspergillus fumigatiaffinis]|nr:hypothetical protein CNMCM5878_004425 [Aspergillus fumigatiaffinis]KAF4236085.1 hypothetical protein CNMCM6457_002692 [Aspergillus fumigatiaffinis]